MCVCVVGGVYLFDLFGDICSIQQEKVGDIVVAETY